LKKLADCVDVSAQKGHFILTRCIADDGGRRR
jgi:hypothetical protein